MNDGGGDSLAEMEFEVVVFLGGVGGGGGGVKLGMIYCLSEAFAYVITFFL